MKVQAVFLRTPYNYDRNAASDESGLSCGEPSRAIQSAAEEADINTIVKRFGLTGKLPENVRMPQYGDFTGVTNYQEALHAVMAAEESFMKMPAHVRERFHNDPASFVDFCANEANREEAEKMGLVVAKPAQEAVSADVQGGGTTPDSKAP